MGEESRRTHDVFLSYASPDKTWADAACAVLERQGVRCWIAPRDITPGDEWGSAIIKGINGSQMMVLIFSRHANASGQVHREVERAISRGIAVLPMRIEDVRPEAAMEYALGNRHWLDAFTPPVERQLELLAQSVKTLLANDPGTGAAPAAPKAPEVVPPRRSSWVWPSVAMAAVMFGLLAAWMSGMLKKEPHETHRTLIPEAASQPGPRIDTPAVAEELVGFITKVDVAGKKLTVTTNAGTDVVVTTTDSTEIATGKGVTIDLEKVAQSVSNAKAVGKKGAPVKVTHEKGVASDVRFGLAKKSNAPVITEELDGFITNVDVAGKKLTVESTKDGTRVRISTTSDTEFITKAESSKIDMEKLSKALTKIQDSGKKGIPVKVTHESGVTSKVQALWKKKAAN